MKVQSGTPLKYKFLFFLVLGPLISLIIYFLIAQDIFWKDKQAYIFNSAASISQSKSNYANSEILLALATVRPILQDYITTQNLGSVSKSLIESSKRLQWIAFFDSTSFELRTSHSGNAAKMNSDINSLQQKKELIRLASSSGLYISKLSENDFLIVDKIGSSNFVYMAKFDFTQLLWGFRNPEENEYYLVDDTGKILAGPAGTEGKYIGEIRAVTYFTKPLNQRSPSGVETIIDPSGAEYIAARIPISVSELMVFSVTSKEAAKAAVKRLQAQSILVLVAILLLSIIVGTLLAARLTSALQKLYQATSQISRGKFDIKVDIRSGDEIGSLATSFNAMAEKIQLLMKETAEKARMESELKTAQTVQETLFPEPMSQFASLQIAGHYEPASECGGDWWHYCKYNNKIYLFIGDATGHGAPAALITSAARSASSIIETLGLSPSKAMDLLNQSIFDVSKGRIMMTFFMASYDLDTYSLVYTNASHESPFIIRPNPEAEKITKKDLIFLNEVNNPRLGESRTTRFSEATVQLEVGDRIFFYTDGLIDLENGNKEPLGERNFNKLVLQVANSTGAATELASVLLEKLKGYRGSQNELKDDITFFVSEVTEKRVS